MADETPAAPVDLRKPCCRDAANRERERDPASGEVFQVCRVCGCRHFGVVIEPMRIGVRGR